MSDYHTMSSMELCVSWERRWISEVIKLVIGTMELLISCNLLYEGITIYNRLVWQLV